MKTWTHSLLVERAARWLKNTYGCKVVLTESGSYTGEIPDAIGWKPNGRSILVECKMSRPDFLADAKKPFRQNSLIALGAERYYMAPPDIIKAEDLPQGWGLLEVKGNTCKTVVSCRPRKDLRSELVHNYEMRMLIDALNRVSLRMEPAQLHDWLRYEHRNDSPARMQTWATSEDHQQYLAALEGFERVVNPTELPEDEVTGEPWCPRHEKPFEDCSCIGPNEQHVDYRVIEGQLMGKPMALHVCKFPKVESTVEYGPDGRISKLFIA